MSLVFVGVCCDARLAEPDNGSSVSAIGTSTLPTATSQASGDEKNETVETFSDDSMIGRSGRNKIRLEIIQGQGRDAASRPDKTAHIKFFSLSDSKEWVLKQSLEIESSALMDSQPQIEDFNNDGLKDITFISNTAARGANEVRTLLVYDKDKDELIHVKNSEDYPNLAYNKTLNCIDAWLFHGATTTVFLRLDGDMLKQFASVDTGAELVVTVVDKNGNERELRREKMNEDDIYTRYETFDPPKPRLDAVPTHPARP